MKSVVLIHYAELTLKGTNRPQFIRQLRHNLLEQALLKPDQIEAGHSYLLLYHRLSPDLQSHLSKIPGIANFSPARKTSKTQVGLKKAALAQINPRLKSFAVRARRADKTFSLTSPQIESKLGAYLQAQTGQKVNLTRPAQTIYVEILPQTALVYTQKLPGLHGLPVSSSGHLLSLISGGLDSPIAAYQLITRGAKLSFIHFHSYPHTAPSSINKVKDLVKLLSAYQGLSRLYLAPLLPIQEAIVKNCSPKYRVTLYRRFMVRIAESLAQKIKARGLVSGESLGQVASQTIESLGAISQAATLPILRPLIGSHKENIIRLAKEIQTYPISIRPDQDCCSLFVPKHPVIKPLLDQVLKEEAKLNVAGLTAQCLKKINQLGLK